MDKKFFARTELVIVLLIFVVALVVWLSATAQRVLYGFLLSLEGFITAHTVWGIVTFISLSAFSAMFFFFSSIALVPISVFVWGEALTFGLLLTSWLLGGIATYYVGKQWGRPVVAYFIPLKKIAYYEERITAHASFLLIFLFRLVAPSEGPGYLLGIIRYPFGKYVLATLLAESPFAFGAVYLSETFLEEKRWIFISILFTGFLLLSVLAYFFHKRHLQ